MDKSDVKERIINLLKSVERNGMQFLIAYLEESDFFTAPASTKFHGCYEGGLAEHSLNVYRLFEHKNTTLELGIPRDSIIITSLLHDLCKVDFYTTEKKSVLKGKKKIKKNKKVDGQWIETEEEVNDWQEEDVYVIKDSFPAGHGEKSVFMIMQYIELTDQEVMMIRWHMGFTEPKDNWLQLNQALEMYPEIIALHAADLEASYLIEGRKMRESD